MFSSSISPDNCIEALQKCVLMARIRDLFTLYHQLTSGKVRPGFPVSISGFLSMIAYRAAHAILPPSIYCKTGIRVLFLNEIECKLYCKVKKEKKKERKDFLLECLGLLVPNWIQPWLQQKECWSLVHLHRISISGWELIKGLQLSISWQKKWTHRCTAHLLPEGTHTR